MGERGVVTIELIDIDSMAVSVSIEDMVFEGTKKRTGLLTLTGQGSEDDSWYADDVFSKVLDGLVNVLMTHAKEVLTASRNSEKP